MLKRFVLALSLATLIAAPATPVRAFVAPVIDLANLAQAITQVTQLIQQYRALKEQLEGLKENWKAMLLDRLMLKAMESRDARLAASAINAIQYLDPNNGQWRDRVETLLRLHYNLPLTNSEISVLRQSYSGNTDALAFRLREEQKMRAPVLDAHHFQAAQEKVARNRQDALDRLQTKLNGLGEKSETKQLQAIGAALVLLGRQQEAQIDALHAKMTQDQHEELMALSALQASREGQMAHAARLRRARNPCNGPCIRYW
jgi:hypothetical protein